ncbi:MAG: flagellar filament capping protein FliD, partial [Planctomycetes bacterium]|nr:flagellar filament capping protein FliD [Planctomycetota bacterium]
GTLTFELGGKRLDEGTNLDDLNGGNGVNRGQVSLIDDAGKGEEIDLSGAVTLADALETLNSNSLGINFSVEREYDAATGSFTGSGYKLKLNNNSTNVVTIAEVGLGSTLEDIGFSGDSINAGNSLTGDQIFYVDSSTKLNSINDGAGIRMTSSGTNDMRFYVLDTSSNQKKSVEVDLGGTEDMGDVLNAINSALFDNNLNPYTTASLSSDGLSIEFSGSISGMQDINQSHAAQDLGLTKLSQASSTDPWVGESLIAELNSALVRNLHGGEGIDNLDTGVFRMTTRSDEEYFVNLKDSVSVQDMIRVISATTDEENGTSTDLSASINAAGNGLMIEDKSSGSGSFRIEDISGGVAEQLGLETNLLELVTPLLSVYDIDTDSNGISRRSAVYLSVNSLPDGITENDIVGRSLSYAYGSRLASTNNDVTGVETAKIIAFEAAPDAIEVSATDAASVSATITNTLPTDQNGDGFDDALLEDAFYLDPGDNNQLDTDNLIGATVTVEGGVATYSSQVIGYDSVNFTLRLSDDDIYQGMIAEGKDIDDFGYTITYNHKLILEYPDPSVVAGTNDVTQSFSDAGATDVITDSTNILAGNPSDLDYSRIVGATISVTDGTNTYSDTISSYDTTLSTLTLKTDDISTNFGGVPANFEDYGYTITYNPISHANGSGGTSSAIQQYLSDNSHEVNPNNPDRFSIVGVTDGVVEGKNLENRMMSGLTRLEDLNGGNGITRGKFIIGADGTSAEIDLTQSSIQTVQDLIDEISANLSNIVVEINDQGDGLRAYEISGSSSSAISISDSTGDAAADLNLLMPDLDKTQIAVSTGVDFYSAKATDANFNGTSNTISSADLAGLNKAQVIGSKVTYQDSTDANKWVSAIVSDYYVDGGNEGVLVIAGQTNEDGTDVSANFPTPLNTEVTVKYQEHFSEYEYAGTSSGLGAGVVAYSAANGTMEVEVTSNSFLNSFSEEELVGSMINVASSTGDAGESKGLTGMITGYTADNGFVTRLNIQTVNMKLDDLDNLDLAGTFDVGIARDVAPKDHVQVGAIDNTGGSYLHNITNAGFYSVTATIDEDSTSSVLQSDQFTNLNPDDVIGSLLTVKEAAGAGAGYVALVTDYDAVNRSVTIGGFYDKTGTAQVITLDTDDEVYLTYESDLEGSVLRSASTSGFSDTIVTALANSDEKNKLRVDDMANFAAVASGEADKLIGASVTFASTTADADLQDETRTIVDVLYDYKGNAGETVIVLDEDLPNLAAAAENFSVSYSDITATIDKIDFSTGIISTKDKLLSAMGDRSFNIHPVVDGSYQKDIEVLSTDTLEDVVAKINLADLGVDANVINDGSSSNPYRLSMTSENSGKTGAVNVSSTITNFGVTLATKAQDAKVIVGDVSGSSSVISSNTNTIVDGIAGMTLNLVSASTEKVTVTVDNDKEGLTEIMTTLVDEVNALLKAANELTALETEVEITNDDGTVTKETQKGILFGDYTARSMIDSVKFLLTSMVEDIPYGELNSYSDIGLTLNSTGDEFDFDDTVFQAKLDANFDQVMELMTFKPNLSPGSGVMISSSFMQENYNINHMRNGSTRSSGYSETGNGTNGIKLLTGDDDKFLTLSLGSDKELYGFRLHHHVPEDLTAKYAVTSAEATAAGAGIVASGTGSKITDATNLASSVGFIEEQLVGATVTVDSYTSTITGYSSGSITLADDLSAVANPLNGYTISTPSGETLDFSYNPVIEYEDPYTGDWEVYQSYQDVDDGLLSVVFPGGLRADSIRLRYEANTGDSLDFTTSGHYARLMEFEVLESQGLGAQFNRTFSGFTDAFSGSLQIANDSLDDQNDTFLSQITRLTESIESKQNLLIKQFQNLELVVSNLNSQSQFFQSQISGLPTAFSHRGNNG